MVETVAAGEPTTDPRAKADAVAAADVAPRPTAPATAAAVVDVDEPGSLGRARRLLATVAKEAGLAPPRILDLLVAVNELLTNSLRHGGGRGDLRAWTTTGWLVCQVDDHGRLPGPVTRFSPPPAGATHGRGLWMANQLADLLQVRSVPDGTSVRLGIRLPSM